MTLTEQIALHGKPKLSPVVRLADGTDLLTVTGHIAEFADTRPTPVRRHRSQ